MTSAQHRAAIDVDVSRPGGPELRGAAPQGMWWVAWRQHRWQIAVLLGLVAAVAVGLVVFRSRIISVFGEFGCELFPAEQFGLGCVDADGVQVWWNHGFRNWSSVAHAVMILGPVVLGAFAAAPIFTREFAHGTHVLALTQSVGRGRWFAAKTTVMAVPLVAGLLLLGFLTEWVDNTVGITAHRSMDPSNFFVRSIVPAATGLMVFGLALAISTITRNELAALIAGTLLGGAALVGIAMVQVYVLPASRTVTPLADTYAPVTQADIDAATAESQNRVIDDPDLLNLGWGYLDAAGNAIEVPNTVDCYTTAELAANQATGVVLDDAQGYVVTADGTTVATPPPAVEQSPEYQTAYHAAMLDCMTSQGVAANYQDYLPGSMLWPLRWVIAGIDVILAALFLGISAWRLKPAIAKR